MKVEEKHDQEFIKGKIEALNTISKIIKDSTIFQIYSNMSSKIIKLTLHILVNYVYLNYNERLS